MPQRQSGFASTMNSTAVPLDAGVTWEGEGESCEGYSSISVLVMTDVDSADMGFKVQFSTDRVNWDREKATDLEAGVSQARNVAVISRWFRVVLVNGSAAQTYLRLQTLLSIHRPRDLTSGTQQVLHDYDDTTLVRLVSDPELDANAGLVDYQAMVQVFGTNPDLSTGVEQDVWNLGGFIPWQTGALAVRARAGGNANDTVDGTGARKIKVFGIDDTWNLAEEEIDLAGASASAATTTLFICHNTVLVTAVGSYGGDNESDIIIETTAGVAVGKIAAGEGRTQNAFFSVPVGQTAYLTRASAVISSAKAATLNGWYRSSADVTSGDMGASLLWGVRPGIQGGAGASFRSYVPFPEKTDVWFSAIASGNNTGVQVDFDFTCVFDT